MKFRTAADWKAHLAAPEGMAVLQRLYAGQVSGQAARYCQALDRFEAIFGPRTVGLVTAPGRTEIGGNHTDHQRGHVLAAAVGQDILCVVARNDDRVVRLHSEGHPSDEVSLNNLAPQAGENHHSAAIIRGVAAWFDDRGLAVGGFDAYTTSRVQAGSGLSSSAAFEVALGQCFSALYNEGTVGPVELAIAGRYAENAYFGKPCGLMDQLTSAVGGFVEIDFADSAAPQVTPIAFDLAGRGYTLCLVDTGGSHAGLTAHYTAIVREMGEVASCFEKDVLGEVDEDEFYAALPDLRETVSDRALLRALHFFGDNRRVTLQSDALRAGDFDTFLRHVKDSGLSSLACLQNIYAGSAEQGVGLGLALSRRLLASEGGVSRVHGGGFAGTVQTYLPDEVFPRYRAEMERVFGAGCCQAVEIRPVGGFAWD